VKTELPFLDDYLEALRTDFEDDFYNEEHFFRYFDIPEDQWDAYRWEAGRSAREALAEKEKRAAEALTVGQLIERLKEFPVDMPVVVGYHYGFTGVNRVAIEKNLTPYYNSYYKGQVTFKEEKRVDVVLISGLS
jgi:hypothetical protein